MRNPSIHVTESILTQELQKLLNKHSIKVKDAKALVKELIVACKQHSLTNRSLSITNEKLLKKATKVSTSGLGGAMLFAKLLTLQRQKLGHRGIVTLTPEDKDWPQLKQVVGLADQFRVEFELTEKGAYTEYIKLALNKMKKFMINKVPSLHSSICQEYEAIQKIQQDRNPEETRRGYSIYSGIVSNKTGLPNIGYDKFPEKYVTFVDIKNEAKKINVSLETYITAQFEFFSFRDGVPDPLQMIGEKAVARVIKYCYEHNINLKKTPTINFKKIKDDRDNNN